MFFHFLRNILDFQCSVRCLRECFFYPIRQFFQDQFRCPLLHICRRFFRFFHLCPQYALHGSNVIFHLSACQFFQLHDRFLRSHGLIHQHLIIFLPLWQPTQTFLIFSCSFQFTYCCHQPFISRTDHFFYNLCIFFRILAHLLFRKFSAFPHPLHKSRIEIISVSHIQKCLTLFYHCVCQFL